MDRQDFVGGAAGVIFRQWTAAGNSFPPIRVPAYPFILNIVEGWADSRPITYPLILNIVEGRADSRPITYPFILNIVEGWADRNCRLCGRRRSV